MGETTVIADNEQQARDYAEEVYMPDLRRNYRELAGLVLASEIPPEQPAETPADGGAENAEPTAPEAI
jgi:hypothetical protein